MIALVRGVTRFTFAPLAISSALIFRVPSTLTFVDLKIPCPLRLRPDFGRDAGKDSDGIHRPTAIFTRRKCHMCGYLAPSSTVVPSWSTQLQLSKERQIRQILMTLESHLLRMEYLVWDWPDWTLALVVLGFITVQPVIV